MTKAKGLKTVSTSAHGRADGSTTGSVVGATVQNIPKTPKSSSVKARAANQRADATRSRVFGAQFPDGVDMDELANKIAARMNGAQMPQAAPQELGMSIPSRPPMSSTLGCDPAVNLSPIDGALSDLQVNLRDLESSVDSLIQAISPVLLYDYDEKNVEKTMALASISPLHSRVLGLNAQVQALSELVKHTQGRVQL